jgi:hypothetical protein
MVRRSSLRLETSLQRRRHNRQREHSTANAGSDRRHLRPSRFVRSPPGGCVHSSLNRHLNRIELFPTVFDALDRIGLGLSQTVVIKQLSDRSRKTRSAFTVRKEKINERKRNHELIIKLIQQTKMADIAEKHRLNNNLQANN